METKKNKSSAKRIITIVCLSLALLIALGAFSFAWIRNNLEFAESEISAGKMRYKLMMYYKGTDGKIVSKELFSTDTDTEGQSQSDKLISVRQDLEDKTLIDIAEGNEVFFVVEKLKDSIDFDISLSFDMHGISNKDTIDKALSAGQNLTDIQKKEQYNYIGSMDFRLKNDTDKLSSILNDGLGIDGYIGNPGDNTAVAESLGYIWDVAEKARLEGDQNFACIRFAINKKAGAPADLDGYKFKLRTKFCVAQKDGLPEDVENKKTVIEVKDKDQLAKAMKEYGFNDEIRVTSTFTYSGDLVFTRPCTFTLNRATLTVQGNVIFSYMYDGEFALNTASEGQLRILKNSDAGGFFKIDLAEASMELIGANNSASGKADIYVENDFTANAAQFDDLVRDEAGKVTGEIIERGLFFKGARICTAENGAIKENLKPVLINGSTKVVVSNRTTLGELTATKYCRAINIVNNGTITKVNLESMGQDTSMISEPCIDIDNGGYFTDTTIRLPRWSKKFDSEDMSSYDDNTRIKANKGSGEMKAITPNDIPEGATQSSQFFPNVDPASISEYFYSRGDKGESGYRDDIDYGLRTQFVEVLNEAGTEIIIHYETPSKLIENYNDVSYLTTLKQYVEHYQTNKICAPTNELTKVTIACYGDKVLTADDYAFIKTMTAMTDLDLSDAVSDGKKVPNNAFNGMSELTNVKMSESDTTWGRNIFTGTKVIEITFPQSLTMLDNERLYGVLLGETVLDNIKYVHTSTTIVQGLYIDEGDGRFFFTVDQPTCDEYRKFSEYSFVWASKFFVDNGVKRYGDYFLRYEENDQSVTPKCEFVVYTGDTSVNWVKNVGFDFKTITIDNISYAISSYDDYALYNRFSAIEKINIVFGEHLETIGKYAFALESNNAEVGVATIVFDGETKLLGNTFSNQKILTSVSGKMVTTLSGGNNFSNCISLKTLYFPRLSVVDGDRDLYNCYALEDVDISVIELDTTKNNNFYSSDGKSSYTAYAKFYIHTENAKSSALYKDTFKALAANERFIFVNEDYAKFYRATPEYTGLTEIGYRNLDEMLKADAEGNPVNQGENPAYYYVIENDEAHLVACLISEINTPEKEFETISSFDGKTVTKIGAAAYHFTNITAKKIKISDDIKIVGNYSFYSRLCDKNCVDLDLNGIIRAGHGAFNYFNMATVTGDFLEEVGKDTFSNNTSLHIANLPNLHKSRESIQSDPYVVFSNCPNLRLSKVGYSNDIEYDNRESMRASYIRFINIKGILEEMVLSKVNSFVNKPLADDLILKTRNVSNSADPFIFGFNNGLENAGTDFAQVYYSDYYIKNVETLRGISGTVELPGYVYYEKNGELTLFAVSPDISEFGYVAGNEAEYVTPNGISKLSDGNYTAKVDSNFTFEVTKIGRHAYGAVRNIAVDTFTIGSNVKSLGYGAFSGSAYVNSTAAINTVLENIELLNLSNVEEIGDYTFRQSNFKAILAMHLKQIGDFAFADSKALVSVYLPAYELSKSSEFDGTIGSAFSNCTSLAEVTLGENAQNLSNNMFSDTPALKTITLLRKQSLEDSSGNLLLSVSNSIVSSKYSSNVTVKVHAGLLAEYKSKFSNGFGGISKFATFENAYTDTNGAIYYWNAIDKSTAYIDYIGGASTFTDITIPSSFEDGKYKVLWVTPEAVRALSAVKTLTLPANMEYLAFSASDLPSTLTTLVIDSNNAKFATDGGVLYNRAKTTVFAYPQSKIGFAFELPSTVNEIYAEAFYGVKHIGTLTISSVVNIGDRAFANSAIDTIKFTSDTASVFAGKDIISGAKDGLVIDVPDTALAAYKANVLVDYSIIGKMK